MHNTMPKILIDAAVFYDFVINKQVPCLERLFPKGLFLIEEAYVTIRRYREMAAVVSTMLQNKTINPVRLPTQDFFAFDKYQQVVKQGFGMSESAAIAYALLNTGKNFAVTSNNTYVKKYCQGQEITCLNTLDILCFALEKQLLAEAACDKFIATMKRRGVGLKVDRIKDYKCPPLPTT